jgi:hypothetical protein
MTGIECVLIFSPSHISDDVESFKGDGEEDDEQEARPAEVEGEDDGLAAEAAEAAAKIAHRVDSDEDPQYPDACFPDHWYEKIPIIKGNDDSPFWQGWAMLRLKTFRLIENKYFETAVIIMILLSSLALVRYYFDSREILIIIRGGRGCLLLTLQSTERAGPGGHLLIGEARSSRYLVLHGPNLYRHLFH